MDRATARKAIAALGARTKTDSDDESLLVWKVRNAIFDSATAGASLLASLERVDPGLGKAVYDYLVQDQILFNVFSFELQLHESPSAQYAAVRHLTAIGIRAGDPRTAWLSQVYGIKLRLVPMLGNPQVLSNILRMLGLCRTPWAERAAEAVNAGKVVARLKVGLSRDLAPAIDLAALLYDLGRHSSCAEVLEQLSRFNSDEIVRRVGLRQSGKLLELLDLVRPQDVAGFAEAVDAGIGDRIAQAFVIDDRERWIEIGHACHVLSRQGIPVRTAAEPILPPNPAHYAAVVWGLHGLPSSAWRRRSLRTCTQRLYSRPPADALALFTGYAVSKVLGAENTHNWPVSGGAQLSLRQLRVLSDVAVHDANVAKNLLNHLPEIRDRLADPTARLDWDAVRLTYSLIRLEQQRGTS
ncbi:hypothetical protein ACFQV2_06190 [Actinokineospora soli]|uniref:Uncharacterized protein n=1 Tax=Actinokineospora soli TaxID=1048753 RepID=A0ABW2TJE3_9PSEU